MIEIRVPCSTSNLGAGFDSIGLAFAQYLTVRYIPSNDLIAAPPRIERSGTLAELTESVERDAVVRAMVEAGAPTNGGELVMTSTIPVGRGLGSSAAATTAGIAIAHMLRATSVTRPSASQFDRSRALALATQIEGHPDNAAPSLLGGLVAVARSGDGEPHAFRLPLSHDIGFVYAAPDARVSTAEARAVLPRTVTHALASLTPGRMAALVHGLETGEPELLRLGLFDEMHVPHRLPLIPGGGSAVEAAVAAGAWGATISGSGSGIIALCPPELRAAVGEAMHTVFMRFAGGATTLLLEVDSRGLQMRSDEAEPWS